MWWIVGPRRGEAASEVCGAAIRQAVEVMIKDKAREIIFLVIGQYLLQRMVSVQYGVYKFESHRLQQTRNRF